MARTFSPGLRLSAIDVTVLIAGIASATVLSFSLWEASVVIALVVSHFFLFCNVFRIRRKPGLIWAGFFVAVITVVSAKSTDTIWMMILPLPLTLTLIGLEFRHSSYHGILWKRINPQASESPHGHTI